MTIPARSQVDITTLMVFHNLSAAKLEEDSTWMSETGDTGKGIQTSCSLVPRRARYVQLRMDLAQRFELHVG